MAFLEVAVENQNHAEAMKETRGSTPRREERTRWYLVRECGAEGAKSLVLGEERDAGGFVQGAGRLKG
jgi:hypothetical protein